MTTTVERSAVTIDDLMTQLDATVAAPIRADIKWYEDHLPIQRGLAQLGSAFIIVAGASIPLLALFSVPEAGLIASVLGISIAVVTGLGAHFRWQQNWLGYLDSQRALNGLLTQLQLAMLQARADGSPDAAIEASRRIAVEANSLVRSETSSNLANRAFPPGK
jgi:hypothetical protein